MDLASELWSYALKHTPAWFAQAAAALVVAVAGAICWALLRLVWRLIQQAWCFMQSRSRTLGAFAQDWSKTGAPEGRGVWLTRPILLPDDYKRLLNSPKVLSIANLKGGVGKTTLTANIGAFLAKEWKLRVLLIDLDFQGSLSSMALPQGEWVPPPGQNSLAAKLISGSLPSHLLPNCAARISLGDDTVGGSLSLIPAYYDLAQADNRVMIEWLLRCRRKIPRGVVESAQRALVGPVFQQEDVRYTLAEILHSDVMASSFEMVIIDCPPRLTTGEIQAFCASSRVLVPTILDRASREAVASICSQVKTLRDEGVCPYLHHLDVVGTMIDGRVNYTGQITGLRRSLGENGIDAGLLVTDTFVPRTQEMVKTAEEGIAYLTMPRGERHESVRNAIGALATHLALQMGIPPPSTGYQPLEPPGPLPGA